MDYSDTSDLYEGGRATMGMGYQVKTNILSDKMLLSFVLHV